MVKKPFAVQKTQVQSLIREDRSLGEQNGNPLQYSCLENPMDRGAWRAIVCRVTRVGYNLATKQQQQRKKNSKTDSKFKNTHKNAMWTQ